MKDALPQSHDRRPRFVFGILLLILVVRLWTMALPGYPPDLNAYKSWSFAAGLRGVHTLYDGDPLYDYPPLYGYLLAPIGKVYSWLYPPSEFRRTMGLEDDEGAPERTEKEREDTRRRAMKTLNVLVKVPPLLFDALMAGLLGVMVVRYRLWGTARSWRGWAPALIYFGLPAILMVSSYWGQPDAVETFFCLLALLLILRRQPELGWICAALGLLMKPLAAPIFPLLALATLMKCGWRRLLSGGVVGMAAGLIGFLPFLLNGRTQTLIDRLIRDIDAMPYTSVNGHNLWWLTGAWRPATEPMLGPISAKQIGLALFLAAYAFVLVWVWKREQRARQALPVSQTTDQRDLGPDAHWFLAGGVLFLSFFALSTHMHENHLLPAIPFFLLLAGRTKAWLWAFLAVGAAVFINCVTHDLILGDLILSKVGGASGVFAPDIEWYLNLPPEMLTDWTLHRAAHLSRLEAALAYGNASLVVLTWGTLIWTMARRR